MKEVEKSKCFNNPFFWHLWLDVLRIGRLGATADDWRELLNCFEEEITKEVKSSKVASQMKQTEDWEEYILSPLLPISYSLQKQLLSDVVWTPVTPIEQCFYSLATCLRDCDGVVYKKASMNLMFCVSSLQESSLIFIVLLVLTHTNGRDEARCKLNKSLLKDLQKRQSEPNLSFLLLVYSASLSNHLSEGCFIFFFLIIEQMTLLSSQLTTCMSPHLFHSILPLVYNLCVYHQSSSLIRIIISSILSPLSSIFIPSDSSFIFLSRLLPLLISISKSSPSRIRNQQETFHRFFTATLGFLTSSLPPSSSTNNLLITILGSTLFLQLLGSYDIPQPRDLLNYSVPILDITIPIYSHELALLGERSIRVITELLSYLISFNSRRLVLLLLPSIHFLFLLFQLALFKPSCESLITMYTQSITLPITDEITERLPSLQQPLSLSSLSLMLNQLPQTLQEDFKSFTLQSHSLSSVWAEGITQMRLTPLQRIHFLLDVVTMVARNPSIFLDVRILRDMVDALMPAMLVQKSGLFQDIEVLYSRGILQIGCIFHPFD